jgi:hypothetical protein
VTRQPSGTGSAEDSSEAPQDDRDDDTDTFSEDDPMDNAEDLTAATADRSPTTDALWTDVRVQPIEIALPAGVGYTLRAYRLSTEVRAPEIGDRDEDFPAPSAARPADDQDEAELGEIDEAELTAQALAAGDEQTGRHRAAGDDADDEAETADAADVAAGESDETADEEGDEPAEPAEVPVFLAEGGKLLLFRSPEGLVEYVRGGADNELTQLDMWDELRARLQSDDIVPLDEDRYELDLVVENLRGGHDVWDPALIIQAGEVARDVAYALRIQPVMTALASGSPLDDLDEGLRVVEAGGFAAFFARRRLRKIDPQTTAALSWRTVIGKISAVVDWRD